jgi:hypothetical protein
MKFVPSFCGHLAPNRMTFAHWKKVATKSPGERGANSKDYPHPDPLPKGKGEVRNSPLPNAKGKIWHSSLPKGVRAAWLQAVGSAFTVLTAAISFADPGLPLRRVASIQPLLKRRLSHSRQSFMQQRSALSSVPKISTKMALALVAVESL